MNDQEIQAKIQQALQFQKSGRLPEAETIYRQILSQHPNQVDALNLLGVIASLTNHQQHALDLINRAIAISPIPEFYRNLALVLTAMRRFDEAVAAFGKSLSLNPLSFEASRGLGHALCELDQPREAAIAYQRSLTLKPDDPSALLGLGDALYQAGDFDEALGRFDRALELAPDLPEPHCSRSLILLTRGDFEHGWPEYESRWRTREMLRRQLLLEKPRWQGSDLCGVRIYIHAERSCGDTFNFARYLPLVAQRGARVFFTSQPDARPLLLHVQGIEKFLEPFEPPPEYDMHCSLIDLPAAFGTTLQSIPPAEPYLPADPPAVQHWKDRVPHDGRLKVGLTWIAKPHSPARSLPPAMLASLANLPNLWLCSLQKDAPAGQLPNITDWTDELKDLSDTAALIANLDLVIAADGSVAHLAAAMGKPVWILLQAVADFRWLLERDDSPWYPTARLFRQKAYGDWSIPVERVTQELRKLTANRGDETK